MEQGTLRTAKEGLCALCYAKAADKCSKCKQRWYCCQACQAKDWLLGHKGDCGLSDIPVQRVPPPPVRLLPESVERPVMMEGAWRKMLESSGPDVRVGPPRGLQNIGNSCYMNAVLQGLHHAAPELQCSFAEHRKSCRNSGESSKWGTSGCFRCDLESIASTVLEPRPADKPDNQLERSDRVTLRGLNAAGLNGQDGVIVTMPTPSSNGEEQRFGVMLQGQSGTKAVRPENLLLRSRAAAGPQQVNRWLPKLGEFTFGAQEDAHEFMRSLLRLVEDEEVKELAQSLRSNGDPSPSKGTGQALEVVLPEANADLTATPSRIFAGLLVSQCTCTNRSCAASSCSFEGFQDLSLNLTEATDSVDDALRLYTAAERLDKKNGWKCETCGEVVRARKQLTIYTAPSVLVLQLKRYRAVMGGMDRGKVTKPIAFTSELNLRPYLCVGSPDANKNLLYELRAVVVHLDKAGFSHFGHYVAYVRCAPPPDQASKANTSRWYLVDDSSVTEVSEADVLRQQAYLLMYSATSREAGTNTASSTNVGAGYPGEAVGGSASSAPAKCKGRHGAVCSFFAAADGLCTQCYREEHGKAPPPAPEAKASAPTPSAPAPEKKPPAPKLAAPTSAGGGKAKTKVGANDPCPCGSGKKFKKCHGAA